MKFVADFHIHSKYSRATSKDMDLENLDKWAKIKGIQVLGSGDFTHPEWFKNLQNKLEPAESGLFKFRKNSGETRFILTSEISCIYTKKNQVRKIHILIFAPDLKTVAKINSRLESIGNLRADGRPILGLDAKDLLDIALSASPDCFVVPAHAWTPWFSVFGSKSGFDSLEECFDDYTKHIYAIETGLSSDPKMNWQVSALDNISLISNSDSHSPQKIGREANIFDTDINYNSIIEAIKTRNPKKFLYTVEFFPEEGKYHYDGHRECGISLSPQETKKYNNICPSCVRPLTIGVLNRVAQLADRKEGDASKKVPFKNLIPLQEIIADALHQGPATKAVVKEYQNLIKNFQSEFSILLDESRAALEKVVSSEIAEGILRVREGKVFIEPGYDGVYGKVKIFPPGEKKKTSRQSALL